MGTPASEILVLHKFEMIFPNVKLQAGSSCITLFAGRPDNLRWVFKKEHYLLSHSLSALQVWGKSASIA